MKRKQKLGVIMLALLLSTTTWADAKISLTNGAVVAAKDDVLEDKNWLKIELREDVPTTGAMFFIQIENSEWQVPPIETTITSLAGPNQGKIVGHYKKNSNREVQVQLYGTKNLQPGQAVAKSGDVIKIPLHVKLTGGEARVFVDSNGSVVYDPTVVPFTQISGQDKEATKKEEEVPLTSESVSVEKIVCFKIGSNKYTVNNEERTMEGNPYLAEGRTMLPLRYLANSLGVLDEAIHYEKGKVTLQKEELVVELNVGSKEIKKDGKLAHSMLTEPVLKEGRVYVPIAEVSALFGIEGQWDKENQTATFVIKNKK